MVIIEWIDVAIDLGIDLSMIPPPRSFYGFYGCPLQRIVYEVFSPRIDIESPMVSIKSVNIALNKRIRAWGLTRNVLHNKYVLYVTVVAVIINMVGSAIMGDLTTPLIFVIVGFLTTFFSKNMFVVLIVGLVVSNVLKYGATMGYAESTEGFEDGAAGTDGADAGESAEPHEIIDTEQYLENDKEKSKKESMTDKKGIDKGNEAKIESTSKKMESMANQYKKLEGLQNQIITGMDQVTTNLTQAEKIMKEMKQHV